MALKFSWLDEAASGISRSFRNTTVPRTAPTPIPTRVTTPVQPPRAPVPPPTIAPRPPVNATPLADVVPKPVRNFFTGKQLTTVVVAGGGTLVGVQALNYMKSQGQLQVTDMPGGGKVYRAPDGSTWAWNPEPAPNGTWTQLGGDTGGDPLGLGNLFEEAGDAAKGTLGMALKLILVAGGGYVAYKAYDAHQRKKASQPKPAPAPVAAPAPAAKPSASAGKAKPILKKAEKPARTLVPVVV